MQTRNLFPAQVQIQPPPAARVVAARTQGADIESVTLQRLDQGKIIEHRIMSGGYDGAAATELHLLGQFVRHGVHQRHAFHGFPGPQIFLARIAYGDAMVAHARHGGQIARQWAAPMISRRQAGPSTVRRMRPSKCRQFPGRCRPQRDLSGRHAQVAFDDALVLRRLPAARSGHYAPSVVRARFAGGRRREGRNGGLPRRWPREGQRPADVVRPASGHDHRSSYASVMEGCQQTPDQRYSSMRIKVLGTPPRLPLCRPPGPRHQCWRGRRGIEQPCVDEHGMRRKRAANIT